MANPVMNNRRCQNLDGTVTLSHHVWCPGCDDLHTPQSAIEESGDHKPVWDWDGNLTSPTFDPSILVQYGNKPGDKRCHSYIQNGMWQYQDDCTHELAGQKNVPMVPLPDWLVRS